MTERANASASELGPPKHCGAYTPGHDVHYIQLKLSNREGPGVAATVTAVDDDGTIHFADGTTKWHHYPARLRRAIERSGGRVLLGAHRILRVPDGTSSYCFCYGDRPTPCPGPAPAPTSLEELADQAQERGGFLISGEELLRLAEQRRPR